MIFKILVGTYTLSSTAFTILDYEYAADTPPILKYIFIVMQNISGWGMHSVFIAVSLTFIFYFVRHDKLQHNKKLNGFCTFCAVFMILGKSYMDLGNWNYLFHGWPQFALAILLMTGTFFIIKNSLILLAFAAGKIQWSRVDPRGKTEEFLFVKHPFAAPLLIMLILALPYLIIFAPGIMQWDGLAHLLVSFEAIPWTKQYPVFPTWLMGKCVQWGMLLFHSQSWGLFLFTAPQYLIQWLSFSYGMYVLKKMRAPYLIRWGSLLFYSLFPLWKTWGYLLCKDTYYYIFFFLFVTVMTDIYFSERRYRWWQWGLLIIGSVGTAHFRGNGIYVLLLFVLWGIFAYRKYWKVYLVVFFSVSLSLGITDGLYAGKKDIEGSPVGEVLSIPIQQTARYIREHYEELTEEETLVLQNMFQISLEEVKELYNPELSDPVKNEFVPHPSKEDMSRYFSVWRRQFSKHPDTYIQAFLNHTYGYFYPDRKCFWEGIGHYYMGNAQHYQDNYFYFEFLLKDAQTRTVIEKAEQLVYDMPVVGMLYSCGLYNLILIGCTLWLLSRRKGKAVWMLSMSLFTVFMCIMSPVNAYIRYMLPVMAALPIHIAWCFYHCHEKDF